MCRNGLYTEHGIKGLNGFGAERWRIAPEFAVKVDPALGILGVLLEPTSVVAKAWDHIDRVWRLDAPPHRALDHRRRPDRPARRAASACSAAATCTSTIATRPARSPRWSQALGATYHSGDLDGTRRRSRPTS